MRSPSVGGPHPLHHSPSSPTPPPLPLTRQHAHQRRRPHPHRHSSPSSSSTATTIITWWRAHHHHRRPRQRQPERKGGTPCSSCSAEGQGLQPRPIGRSTAGVERRCTFVCALVWGGRGRVGAVAAAATTAAVAAALTTPRPEVRHRLAGRRADECVSVSTQTWFRCYSRQPTFGWTMHTLVIHIQHVVCGPAAPY